MRSGPAGELLRAIDLADDLAHNARSFPLTAEARISKTELEKAVARIREAAIGEGVESDEGFRSGLDRLVRLASGASAVPLTDEVRVDREEMCDTLDLLRAEIPQRLKEARWEWKQAGGVDPPSSFEIEIRLNDDR
jgi:hypothetical protein